MEESSARLSGAAQELTDAPLAPGQHFLTQDG
jgi:hypothetical protein